MIGWMMRDNDQIKVLFCVMKSESMKTAMIPEISIQELADNIEFEDFSRRCFFKPEGLCYLESVFTPEKADGLTR